MMLKKLILKTFLLSSSIAYSQIGINTNNAQHVFHIDGRATTNTENPTTGSPSNAQQIDDFVVTSNGDVGIGTLDPKGKMDVVSTTSGFIPPRLSLTERDNLIVDMRPAGALIYNTDVKRLQINIGTAELPVWSTLDVASETFNKSIVFDNPFAFGSQVISYTNPNFYSPVLFNRVAFNNTPSGYITKMNNNGIIILKAGKTYKLEVNMGRTASRATSNPESPNDYNPTKCQVRNINDNTVLSTVTILPNGNDSANNPSNNMMAYLSTGASDKYVTLECSKTISGTIHVNYVVSPVWTITITD